MQPKVFALLGIVILVLGIISYIKTPKTIFSAAPGALPCPDAAAIDELSKFIRSDKELTLINFGGFNTKQITGAAATPAALERLRQAYDRLKPKLGEVALRAKVDANYTPHVVKGKVVGPNGPPLRGCVVHLKVLDYKLPEGVSNRTGVVPLTNFSAFVAESGTFEFLNLPTQEGADVVLTADCPPHRPATETVRVGSSDIRLQPK